MFPNKSWFENDKKSPNRNLVHSLNFITSSDVVRLHCSVTAPEFHLSSIREVCLEVEKRGKLNFLSLA